MHSIYSSLESPWSTLYSLWLNFFAISYGWDVMSWNRLKSAFFEGVWVTLNADFRGKGALPTNHCWCQKTTVIAVSCGIKISAVNHLVLSQYTHLMHGQTEGQNCNSNNRVALHAVARKKRDNCCQAITQYSHCARQSEKICLLIAFMVSDMFLCDTRLGTILTNYPS